MNLNLGGGDDRREGYLNVDLRPECADVLADVRDLPFGSDSAGHILALDILEHLPPCSTLPVLQHWYDILKPGGVLTVRVPNLYQLSRAITRHYECVNHDMVRVLIENVYGGHKFGPEGSLDRHETGWTPAEFDRLLQSVGFVIANNDEKLNMTVEAIKP